MDEKTFVELLIAGWNAPVVARTETKKFTGGAICGRTVANIESLEPKNKVPGRMKIGRKVTYPTRPYAEWIGHRLFKEA
jgi:hypothetical protein